MASHAKGLEGGDDWSDPEHFSVRHGMFGRVPASSTRRPGP